MISSNEHGAQQADGEPGALQHARGSIPDIVLEADYRFFCEEIGRDIHHNKSEDYDPMRRRILGALDLGDIRPQEADELLDRLSILRTQNTEERLCLMLRYYSGLLSDYERVLAGAQHDFRLGNASDHTCQDLNVADVDGEWRPVCTRQEDIPCERQCSARPQIIPLFEESAA